MRLSQFGEIVAAEWQRTEQIRPNPRFDEWIIMPNHIHGIIIIEGHTGMPDCVEASRRGVSTTQPGLQPNSLGSIIGQIESVCTKRMRDAGFPRPHHP